MIQPVLAISATFWLDSLTWIIAAVLIAIVFAVPRIMKALHSNPTSQHSREDTAQQDTPKHSHRIGQLQRITLPNEEHKFIKAIAQDGIELCFRLKVDLKFIGRPEGHEPVAVVVALPMVASLIKHIGDMPSHQTALIYPDKLIDFAMKQNQVQNSWWQVVDLQIIDMEVGRNIGNILTKAREAGIDIAETGKSIDQLADEFS